MYNNKLKKRFSIFLKKYSHFVYQIHNYLKSIFETSVF